MQKMKFLLMVYLLIFTFQMFNREFIPLGVVDFRFVAVLLGFIIILFGFFNQFKQKTYRLIFNDSFFVLINLYFLCTIIFNLTWLTNDLTINRGVFLAQMVSVVYNYLFALVIYLYLPIIKKENIVNFTNMSFLFLFVSLILVQLGVDLNNLIRHEFRYYYASNSLPFNMNRLAGFAQDPNFVAVLSSIVFFINLQFKNKWAKVIIPLAIIAQFVAFSRTLLLVGAVCVLLYLIEKLTKKTKMSKAFHLFSIFTAAGLILAPFILIVGANFPTFGLNTMSTRIHMWNSALDLFREYPIFGGGVTGFRSYFDAFGGWYVQPHNNFLSVLSESGIFAFIFFLLIIFIQFSLKDKWHTLLTLMIIGIFFSYEVTGHAYFVFVFVLLYYLTKNRNLLVDSVIPDKENNKKKILFLIHTLGGGGAEKVLVNLVNHLNPKNYDITLMTIIDTGIHRESLADHVNYKTIFRTPFNKPKVNSNSDSGSLLGGGGVIKKIAASVYRIIWSFMPTKMLYNFAIKDRYDIEIAFLEGISAKLIAASPNKLSQKICWIHVDVINEKKSEKFFFSKKQEKRTYQNFNKIVCVSENVRMAFIEKFNFNKDKVYVRYNPLDSIEIIQKSNHEPVISRPEKKLIVTIGRLINQKGYDRLVRVVNTLKQDGFDFELWIIGDGLDRLNLESYLTQNNLHDYVKLLGFIDNPYKYLKQADLFVCSSYAEGFSTVASEAVILGKPVITTDCSGMKELLGYNNEYGIVTDNSEIGLYQGLKSILSDDKLFQHYKQQVKTRGAIFDLATSVSNIESLWNE